MKPVLEMKGIIVDFGRCAGASLATVCSLVDGALVIGGGLTGASKYIMPSLMEELGGTLEMNGGQKVGRLQSRCVFIDDDGGLKELASAGKASVKVHGSEDVVTYDREWRTPVLLSRCGASEAISAGAYVFALASIDAGN